MTEQIKAFGINAELTVLDWPTQRKKREDPKAWQHLLHGLWHRALSGRGVGHPGPRAADGSPDVEGRRGPHPALRGPRQQAHVRGAEGRLREAQERIYDQVHAIKFGDLTKVQAARANVKGFKPYRIPRMWNVWLRSRDGAPRPVAHRPRGGGTIRAPALTYRRRRVIGYLLRRILRAVPVLFLVTLVSFFIMQIVPGDPASIIAGLGRRAQEVERVRHVARAGPAHARPARELVPGHGRGATSATRSSWDGASRGPSSSGCPATLSLSLYALVLTAPDRDHAAARPRCSGPTRGSTRRLMTVALLGVSLAELLARAHADRPLRREARLAPVGNGDVPLTQSVWGGLKSGVAAGDLAGPRRSGSWRGSPARRCSRCWSEDFIRTARTKGLSESTVVAKHAFKNVMIPVVTIIGITREPAPLGVGRDRDRLLAAGRRAGSSPRRCCGAITRSSRAGCSWSRPGSCA